MVKTWVLVADSTRARIFSADKNTGPITEFETLAHPEGRLHEQHMTSDLPGKHGNGTGLGRHGMGDQTEPKRQEQIYFAKRIAERLEQGRTKGDYGNLIIVAAPTLLGLLRDHLSSSTSKLVAHQLDKNLARLNARDIRGHLPERLPSA